MYNINNNNNIFAIVQSTLSSEKSHLLRNNERIFDFFPHCDWHTYWLVVGHELLMYFL